MYNKCKVGRVGMYELLCEVQSQWMYTKQSEILKSGRASCKKLLWGAKQKMNEEK